MFTQRTLDFLYFNHKENSPQWYKDHKADYEEFLVKPFKELVVALTPALKAIDGQLICDPKVDRSISRIYRDMRYATDGYRYRDHCWAIFARDKKMYEGLPGYYFEVSPYKFSFGCGYYQASPSAMKNFRRLIIQNSAEYIAARDALKGAPVFEVYGDVLKTSKYDAYPPEAQDLLCRSNIGVSADSTDYDLLMSPALPSYLATQFSAIAPFYNLLLTAELTK